MAFAPLFKPRHQEHLDRARNWNRGQGAEHTRDLGPDEHGDQDRERREPDRAAIDQRLEDVVLELLVEDEEDDQDDPGRQRVQESRSSRR